MFFNKNISYECFDKPFKHWELYNTISDICYNEIMQVSQSVIPSVSHKKRSEHQHRTFIRTGVVAKAVNAKATRDIITQLTGVDLSHTRARLEVCVDLPGFSLEPHIDIPEKLITLQTYIDGEENCGTNLYPKIVNFKSNYSWLIVNNPNTLHGFDTREFSKPRVSIVLNYVTDEWWDVDQLVCV